MYRERNGGAIVEGNIVHATVDLIQHSSQLTYSADKFPTKPEPVLAVLAVTQL